MAGNVRKRCDNTQHLGQLADLADLAPHHAQHQSDHDRQVQHPLTQAEAVEVSDLSQRCGVNELSESLRNLLIGRRGARSLAAIPLNGPRVTHGTRFSRLLGGVVSVGHETIVRQNAHHVKLDSLDHHSGNSWDRLDNRFKGLTCEQ